MTVLEFFSQDRKKLQKDINSFGITDIKNLPDTIDAIEKTFNLEKSNNIDDYIYIDGNSSRKVYDFRITLDLPESISNLTFYQNGKTFTPCNTYISFYIEFTGKCHVKSIYVYNAYNTYEIVNNYVTKLGRCRYNIPIFEDSSYNVQFETVADILKLYNDKIKEYTPYIEFALDIYKNKYDEVVETFNTYNVKNFDEINNEIFGRVKWVPTFMEIVELSKKFKEIYNYDITIQDLILYKKYLNKHDKETANFQKILDDRRNIYIDHTNDPELVVPESWYARERYVDAITFDRWTEIFEEMRDTEEISKNEKWKEVYTNANKEFAIAYNELRKTISEKYGISEKYLNNLVYSIDKDKLLDIPSFVPDDAYLK